VSGRRFLALHLPLLGTDRIRQREPELLAAPLATWTTQGNRRILIGVDAPSTALHAGQALADAQAMHPDLILRPADPAADLAFLDRLALWALRFTPLSASDPPAGLVLDVTGCTDLFGGEAALLTLVAGSLMHGGVTARAVIAGLAEAAAVLARAGRHGLVVVPGRERAAIAILSLGDLRLPDEQLAGLHRLGLQRIGDLLRQPRAPLARRFGRTLLDTLDALTGDRPRVLQPVRPQAEFTEALNFPEPIVTRPSIDRALDTLLERLCRALGEAGRGARKVTLRAFRVDRDVQEVTIGTGLAVRAPAHLRRLFAEKLERLEPNLGFERITLQADVTNVLDAAQSGMDVGVSNARQRQEEVAQLLDRLSQRVKVRRLAATESHWPERSVVRVGPFDPVADTPALSPLPAPVRLLNRPVPLTVVAEVPDGPPARVRLDGKVHKVAWADGPERLEPEWWRDPPDRLARDYYRVELDTGARLWIGRTGSFQPDEAARWFLHGYLP
jgi:protein ImuB